MGSRRHVVFLVLGMVYLAAAVFPFQLETRILGAIGAFVFLALARWPGR